MQLWKSLKTLGLPNKNGPASKICLKTDDKVSFDNKENAETFKNFYDIKIKQQSKVKYFGYILDKDLSGESMAIHALGKINSRLKFLYRNQAFLNSSLTLFSSGY